MSDYTTIASLMSSVSVFLLAIAYFFGKLTYVNEIRDKDRDVLTIDGIYFILQYILFPSIVIVCVEIFTQWTSGTRLITLALFLLLAFQFTIGFIFVTLLLNVGRISIFFKSLNRRIAILLLGFLITIFDKSYFRVAVMFCEIIISYFFIKTAISRHLFPLNMPLPMDYGMWVYVLSSVIITFVSFSAARMMVSAADDKKHNIVVQLNDDSKVEGTLLKWGKFIEIQTNGKVLYINEDNVRSLEHPAGQMRIV